MFDLILKNELFFFSNVVNLDLPGNLISLQIFRMTTKNVLYFCFDKLILSLRLCTKFKICSEVNDLIDSKEIKFLDQN